VYETSSLTSRDGTSIGYRQLGHGPGVVLVQGAMGSAHNFMELAAGLSDTFTAYLPDRRGRGLSSLPYSEDYCMQRDVEDLDALLRKTGARYVFGLSSGALIALTSALTLPAIQKLALFEPALFIDGVPTALLGRFQKEIAGGRVPAALITAMKATEMGPPIFNLMPRLLLERLTAMAMAQEEKKSNGDYIPMRQLAATLQYDFQVVLGMSGSLDTFSQVNADVLLLGGSKSPAYLKTGLAALEKALPHVTRVELAGLNHGASWNRDRGGAPGVVAAELRKFFSS